MRERCPTLLDRYGFPRPCVSGGHLPGARALTEGLPAGKATGRSEPGLLPDNGSSCAPQRGGWSASGLVQDRTRAVLHKTPHFMRGVADPINMLS